MVCDPRDPQALCLAEAAVLRRLVGAPGAPVSGRRLPYKRHVALLASLCTLQEATSPRPGNWRRFCSAVDPEALPLLVGLDTDTER